MSIDRPIRNGVIVLLSVLAPTGCLPHTDREAHPVAGAVRWAGGDLTGHAVEFVKDGDPATRGFGSIGPDGAFAVERYAAGRTTRGLPAGTYSARLVLNDEGDGQTKKPRVPSRYFDPKSSGWSVSVPTTGDVTLTVAAK